VEQGGPAVVVGRGRGRVVRRAAVVADTGGRGGGEQGVRRSGRGGPRSSRRWTRRRRRRPPGGIPHRPAAPLSSLSAGGGGPGARRQQQLRINKSIDLARPRSVCRPPCAFRDLFHEIFRLLHSTALFRRPSIRPFSLILF
jgi:hypothetical protein